MAQRLKRWESPRKEGRNDKGRGGSARQRQLKKQRQALRRRLKDEGNGQSNQDKRGEDVGSLPFLWTGERTHLLFRKSCDLSDLGNCHAHTQ
jgi:hypothetical protein